MTDVEQTGPGIEEEDLEDGEIESDDDDTADQKPAEVAKPTPSIITTTPKAPAKPVESRLPDPSPPKKSSKPNKLQPDEEDFATSLERQLAQALGKPIPTSPVHQPEEEKRSGGSKKNRKRKRNRNESPPPARLERERQEKLRKVGQGFVYLFNHSNPFSNFSLPEEGQGGRWSRWP